jgi:hypothetical protein
MAGLYLTTGSKDDVGASARYVKRVCWNLDNVNARTAEFGCEEVEIGAIMSGLKDAIKTVSS